MRDLIPRTLQWLRLLFAPGTGKRRHRVPFPTSPSPRPHHTWPPQLPRHRSPYGLATPLDGNASALVRPYLAADFGIDLDRHLIGAQEVAA
ncbi:hypothetical protein SLINC_5392 [Streptomyces lincolnensis]|uniref:Uncharacterized protein n=1 Tax=Streptomyces lincolnensis TaxID=1915 RepID=A0A1B1MG72_STRLN|nr:hypothetical protein [Streptomyces lincolnensis]ANS67616.1 hypothetical protein SLINC_5392 [Streptomyces lincolnensis]AXG54931.1 hypothetical protein SLCG_3776 [Streptomyces lincolnensis]QMV09282.1 hypothetical protein GJU35_28970 [Streptomyces lincolnensis]